MLGFITENLGSILVGAVVLIVLVLVFVFMAKNGKKTFCSCDDCSGCSNCGTCNIQNARKIDESKKEDHK